MPKCKYCLSEDVDWRSGAKNDRYLCDTKRVRTLTDAGILVNGYNLHECSAKVDAENAEKKDEQIKLQDGHAPPPENHLENQAEQLPFVREQSPGFRRWCAEEYQLHDSKYGAFARAIIKDEAFPKKTKEYQRIWEYIIKNYSIDMAGIFNELYTQYKAQQKQDHARRMGIL